MPNYDCFWVDRIGELWIRQDTKESWQHASELPVGALWDAPRMKGDMTRVYPDGITLVCKTPDGDWIVDGPSYDGTTHHFCPWTREGDPRSLTVRPSIHFPGRYHGFLTNGVLHDV